MPAGEMGTRLRHKEMQTKTRLLAFIAFRDFRVMMITMMSRLMRVFSVTCTV